MINTKRESTARPSSHVSFNCFGRGWKLEKQISCVGDWNEIGAHGLQHMAGDDDMFQSTRASEGRQKRDETFTTCRLRQIPRTCAELGSLPRLRVRHGARRSERVRLMEDSTCSLLDFPVLICVVWLLGYTVT
ncbi:hypothetical protein L798_00227 [Zootermopsis nevadensis]|uniref:Uncharacterized protein n=1 Tax=Zootermopsis nevadensis TaxID=136037 RepID=A0A067QM38_ZOONE|nr:hypothetical protein L798_00227 [Zootermopsis nevadensis]